MLKIQKKHYHIWYYCSFNGWGMDSNAHIPLQTNPTDNQSFLEKSLSFSISYLWCSILLQLFKILY